MHAPPCCSQSAVTKLGTYGEDHMLVKKAQNQLKEMLVKG
jgi:hypothetical protein